MTPPFVVVGNPENRRVAFFRDALKRVAGATPVEVSWLDLARGEHDWTKVPPDACVRIDSPGENWEVEKAFIERGLDDRPGDDLSGLASSRLGKLEFDLGRIRLTRAWYFGFLRILRDAADRFASRQARTVTPHPEDVAILFDKRRCHAHCRAADVPVPEALGPISGYDELVAAMDAAGWTRAFVKIRHGSSASGVVALERRGGRVAATTSAELVEVDGERRLYNSLRVRRYADEAETRALIDSLAREGLHVERWLPKASLNGRAFDLRLLTIAGEPRHLVVRASRGPLTNLHLGNARGDAEQLARHLGPEGIERLHRIAKRVAEAFSRTLTLGIDVVATPGFREFAVVEVNAFGDLLPRVTHRGEDTYAAQVRATLERHDRIETAAAQRPSA